MKYHLRFFDCHNTLFIFSGSKVLQPAAVTLYKIYLSLYIWRNLIPLIYRFRFEQAVRRTIIGHIRLEGFGKAIIFHTVHG